jgi:2-polyprenyl-6-methoxyphenol hydroxylase-like FAD-dependent oxidoreductase
MEHFRRWGLADKIRNAAPIPINWSQDAVFCTSLLGTEITRFKDCFGLAPNRADVFAESGQQIPQPLVELVLREAVVEFDSVEMVVGAQGVAIDEHHDHVIVSIRDDHGRDRLIQAQYVLGCDGRQGISRAAIGARYLGSAESRRNLNIVFRAPGLAEEVPHGPAIHYWVLNAAASGLVGRLDLDSTWFVVGVNDREGALDPRRVVRELIGADFEMSILATDRWNARSLVADSYGTSRVFLVGDAAHLVPPWGGHGFNTGLGDAVNIAWKIAAVLGGWGGPGLLTSYEAERRPVAVRTIDTAKRQLSRTPADLAALPVGPPGPIGAAARALAAAEIQRDKASEFHSLGLVLGYSYRGSPIVAAEDAAMDGDDDVTSYRPTAEAGARLPHAWLPDGTSLYDHLGPDYTLLRLDPAIDVQPVREAAAAVGLPLTVVDNRGRLDVTRYGAGLVLTRPDQHVAWRGDSVSDAAGLVDLVRGDKSIPPLLERRAA